MKTNLTGYTMHNVEICDWASTDGVCFQAELHFNGELVAFVKNNGHAQTGAHALAEPK